MKIKIKFDTKNIVQKLDKVAKKISGKHKADEIFTKSFMQKNTNFSSFEEMFSYSGFEQDFVDIPDEDRNYFVAETTKFKNRIEMQKQAGEEFIKNNFKL